jgi:hypothetical protein
MAKRISVGDQAAYGWHTAGKASQPHACFTDTAWTESMRCSDSNSKFVAASGNQPGRKPPMANHLLRMAATPNAPGKVFNPFSCSAVESAEPSPAPAPLPLLAGDWSAPGPEAPLPAGGAASLCLRPLFLPRVSWLGFVGKAGLSQPSSCIFCVLFALCCGRVHAVTEGD